MSAPRSVSTKALRQLSLGSRQQIRQLHMTEPRDIPSRLLVKEGVRTTEASRSKSKKDNKSSNESAKSKRQFNTSRALKSPNDTSTIDFAFLPMEETLGAPSRAVRVPILPHVSSPVRNGAMVVPAPDYDRVHKVEIVTASADSTHVASPSPMAEVHDNESVHVDFHRVADALKSTKPNLSQQPSAMKQLWDGLVEDIMGPQRKPSFA